MRIYLVSVFSALFALSAADAPTNSADSKPAAVQSKIFSLAINPPADAALTEIEFSDIDLSTATDAAKISGARVKTVRTKEKVFREYLAPEIQFFRVRSIHKTGVAGAYSKTYSIKGYLKKPYREPTIPVVQQGQTEYLLGSRIELPTQPNLVTKYKLGDGEFVEYREPLVFDKPDTYKMQVNLENADKQVVYTKNFVFKVELNPPKTRAVIVDPVHSKRGVSLGKDSSLVFLVDDAESGMAKIFYRVVPLGKDANSVQFAEYGKRLTYADISANGAASLVQFYAIDKAGNKEEVKTEMLFCEIEVKTNAAPQPEASPK
ncbi:MAG: hypothetical protein J0L53_16650 [Spirochaetes bacterium]|nr:hypothetical protein [Spirochaetota bacterium]